MAKEAKTVLIEMMGKKLDYLMFGAELKKLSRQAAGKPESASFINGYTKKIEEYAETFQKIQQTIGGVSLNAAKDLQGHIDKVADFGQFLTTKPEGSERSIFQILYANTKDDKQRQTFMDYLHYVDTTLGLGINFTAPEMSTDNLIPAVQELKEEKKEENNVIKEENKVDIKEEIKDVKEEGNAAPENEKAGNENNNEGSEIEENDDIRVEDVDDVEDIIQNNANNEIQNNENNNEILKNANNNEIQNNANNEIQNNANNEIQNNINNNEIQNNNEKKNEPEKKLTFSQQIDELEALRVTVNQLRINDLYWSQVSESVLEAIADFTESLEKLREVRINSVDDLKGQVLDRLDEVTRNAVDNFTYTYVKNMDKLNRAYAILAYDRDMDREEGVQKSHTNPEVVKAVKKTVDFAEKELKRNLKVMDKMLLLNIKSVDDYKQDIGGLYDNKRPSRTAVNELLKNNERELFENEKERSENARMAYSKNARPLIINFESSFGKQFGRIYENKEEVQAVDTLTLEEQDLIKRTGMKTLDFNGTQFEVFKYPSKEAEKTIRNRIHVVNVDMKKTLKDYDATKQEKELVSSVYLKNMDRIEKGYSDSYMMYKSPLAALFANIGADCRFILEGHKLDRDMNKWGEKFPIYDYSKKTSEISDTFVDYWEAKKKVGGALSPKKEQENRIKLYDQVVSAAIDFDKMMYAVEDPETAEQIRQDDLYGNDPFHIHPLANRGCKSAAASLDAYKRGLEQGWAIDDLAMVSAFKLVADHIEDLAVGNGAMSTVNYKIYNPPKWASEETKNFIQKMNNLYEKMVTTPLTSAEQRKAYMDRMDAMISEGIEKDLFNIVKEKNGVDEIEKLNKTDYVINYYDQISKQRAVRDVLIEKGKEMAFHPTIDKHRHIEVIEARLNTRRTDIKFWSENQEHKDLRIAFAELKDYIKNNPKKERNPEEMKKYARMMLNRLDTVERLASIYSKSHRNASSSGGKERLAGSIECGKFAKDQKHKLLSEMKKAGFINKDADVNEMRTYLALDKMIQCQNELEAMDKLPRDEKGANKVYNLAANIVVGRIASGSGMKGKKMLEEYGIWGLKEKVADNKEFRNFITDCVRHKNLSGKEMFELISGDGIIKKIQGVKDKIETDNAELEATKGPVKRGKVAESNIPRKPIMSR